MSQRVPLQSVKILLTALSVFIASVYACYSPGPEPQKPASVAVQPEAETSTPTPIPGEHHAGSIREGDNLVRALMNTGVSKGEAEACVEALKEIDFPFTALRPGQSFVVTVSETGGINALEYEVSPLLRYSLLRVEGRLFPSKHETVTTSRVSVMGARVETSVYAAILEAGGTDALATLVSELFAWDIDFSMDPRKGDSFRLIYETNHLPDGTLSSYGRLLAGEYVGEKTGTRQGFFFDADDDAWDGFYNVDGMQLKRTFLKAPLDTMRITSRFGYRNHPILHARMMHHGVDYGASVGTPVKAVADGTVTYAGYNGAAGNMVSIKHSGNIVTMYLHLSRLQVTRGQRVSQGRTIGRVGSTGRSTGPHLDFRVQRGGRYINPLSLKMYSEPARKMPEKFLPLYQEVMAEMRPRLEAVPVPEWPPMGDSPNVPTLLPTPLEPMSE